MCAIVRTDIPCFYTTQMNLLQWGALNMANTSAQSKDGENRTK